MKKLNKVLITLIIIFLLINICSQAFALEIDRYNITNPSEEDAKLLTDRVGVILGVVRNLSVVVAVLTLMIIGVKYILGSVEQKANYKAAMLPYVIGCLLAVAGTTLVSFIYETFR